MHRSESDVAADGETTEIMRELAEAFREVNAENGDTFGWETREASRLDAVCDRFLGTNPPASLRHSMVMAMGAYLGELMARHGDGCWVDGTGNGDALLRLANGLVCDPHDEVAKRLELGPQHDLGVFFHFSLAGHIVPDALAG